MIRCQNYFETAWYLPQVPRSTLFKATDRGSMRLPFLMALKLLGCTLQKHLRRLIFSSPARPLKNQHPFVQSSTENRRIPSFAFVLGNPKTVETCQVPVNKNDLCLASGHFILSVGILSPGCSISTHHVSSKKSLGIP